MHGRGTGHGRPSLKRPSPAPASTRELFEVVAAGKVRVDREAGIIFGVKMLGQVSVNTHDTPGVDRTEYTDAAMADALPLYEGLPAYIDHAGPGQTRSVRSAENAVGKWREVQHRRGDGYYGNLKLLKSHPMATRLMEAAESDDLNDLFTCSHHAYGQSSVKGRTLVVTKIPRVKSVDIVTSGGTVRSLFEASQTMKTTTIRQLWESVEARLDEGKRAKVRQLLEDEAIPGDLAMTAPAVAEGGDVDPDEALAAGFRAAAVAVLDDDSLDLKGKLAKLKEILTYEEKLMGGDDEPEEEEAPAGEGEVKESLQEAAAKNPAVKKLLESHDALKAKARLAKKRAKAKELCEAARLPKELTTKVFLESLMDARDDQTMRQLVEDRAKLAGVGRPRSAAVGHGAALGGGSGMSVKDFTARVRGF